MALRSFRDSQGNEWRVWNVVPHYSMERDEQSMTPGLQGGWLCFENAGEKRRLSPIPHDWENAEHDVLEGYCREALAVAARQTVG